MAYEIHPRIFRSRVRFWLSKTPATHPMVRRSHKRWNSA